MCAQRVVSVVFESLKAITSPQRLLTHDDFALFVYPIVDESGPIGEGLDIGLMIVRTTDCSPMCLLACM